MGEIVFYSVCAGILFFALSRMFRKSESEKNEERKIKERLNDDFLYDPETGARFTLEQAQSGTWIAHSNTNRIKDADELDKYYSGSEKTIEEIANYLKQNGYFFKPPSSNTVQLLLKTELLKRYSDPSFYNSFSWENENHLVLFPKLSLTEKGRYGATIYKVYSTLFVLKIPTIGGHYYLRNKTTNEKLLDLLRPDDDLDIRNMEVFTIVKSATPDRVIQLASQFTEIDQIELEFHNELLYVKTNTEPTLAHFLALENIVKRAVSL